ncbi:MAG: MATE family efflux transporter [Bacteroidetes bacterium]|nr:MATE family efflux transporter [Bacteroidota bacterium]
MNKEILRIAIPNIISNITIPLLGMVDLAILGHLESGIYIGAVALGSMIFNFIYFGFGFLRMSSSGFTAQAYGANDNKKIILTLSRAVIVALIGSFLILILQYPIAHFGFNLISGSPAVETLAKEYFQIRIFAAPAAISLFAITGWFLGMQNARYPMIIAISITSLNLIFNFIFIYGFGMKSEGVAWGTLIAQYCGLALAIVLFLKKYRSYLPYWSYQSMMQLKALKRYLMVNRDILIRTILLLLTLSFFTAESASISDEILAANTILLQFFFLFSYLIDGFSYAAEALVGKQIGARNSFQLKRIIKDLFKWGLGISLLFTAIYYLGGKSILYLITTDNNVIANATPYLIWIVSVPLLTFAAFIWDGIYIGATASSSLRNTMLISTVVLFLPFYYFIGKDLGNHGLWLSFMLFMVSRGIMLTLFSGKIRA